VEQGRSHGYELITDQAPEHCCSSAVSQDQHEAACVAPGMRLAYLGMYDKPHDIKRNGLHETGTYQ
jgi:hypothetical protein